MKILKQMFCKHDWGKLGFYQTEDEYTRYPMRHYECCKCKKDIWVDGRYDKIDGYSHIFYYIRKENAMWEEVSENSYYAWTGPKYISEYKLTTEYLEEVYTKYNQHEMDEREEG